MDPGSPKLLVPTILCAVLRHFNLSPVERASYFVIAYWAIVKSGLLKVSISRADLIVPAALVAAIPDVPAHAATAAFFISFAFIRMYY